MKLQTDAGRYERREGPVHEVEVGLGERRESFEFGIQSTVVPGVSPGNVDW